LKLEYNTAAVWRIAAVIAAGVGHAVEIPGRIEQEIGIGTSSVTFSGEGIQDALRPKALASGRHFEDDAAA
jgi:hypothetical protein